jgi:glycosyltransferase involved in cell wall biosynthesis
MWNGKTLSVVLPTYNEKDSIAGTINDFADLGIVDDILVVNNNAVTGTSEEVAGTSARRSWKLGRAMGRQSAGGSRRSIPILSVSASRTVPSSPRT